MESLGLHRAALAALGVSCLALALLWRRHNMSLTKLKSLLIKHVMKRTIRKLTAAGAELEIAEKEVDGGGKVRYYKNAPKTLNKWYDEGRKHGSRSFIFNSGSPSVELTYDDVFKLADKCRGMLHSLGVRPGHRVAICTSNIPEFIIAFMAATQLGAIAVTLNAFWEGDELDFGLSDSTPTVLIADDRRLQRVVTPKDFLSKHVAGGLKVVVVRPSPATVAALPAALSWDTLMASAIPVPEADVQGSMDACLMYTSGTTSGRPKGVVLTHENFVQAMVCYQLFSDLLKTLRGPSTAQRVDLVTSPLFHTSALVATFLLSFKDGHKLVLMPKWDAEAAVELSITHKVTFLGCMPTMLSDFLACKAFREKKHLLSITNIGTGGASIPSELVHSAKRAMPSLGQGSGWGMTETCAIGTIIGGPDYLDFTLSCGRAHEVVDIKVIDPDTLKEMPEGQAGELCIRSPTMMRGYWNNPEETSKVMLKGGWIRTGDIGRIDETGLVYIIDRIKDLVIRGGENISCAEVEDCVFSLPGRKVLEVAAFGLKHARLGEQLCVAIVVAPGAHLTEKEVLDWCQSRLAKFKVPSMVFLRTQVLPRGATGKVQKRDLRQEYESA